MNKTIKALLFCAFSMLTACDDTPGQVREYTESGVEEITQVMQLMQMQSKYPNQFEFSLRSILKLKDVNITNVGRELFYYENRSEGKEVKRFYSSLGLIEDKYVLENEQDADYIIISFNHSNYTREHPEATYNVCYTIIENLKENNHLYGFNINNKVINKRIVDLNDKKWTESLCKTYVNDLDSILRIALNPS